MSPSNCEALDALLAQMRMLHRDLDQYGAGICVLHLEAAIAALESHLRRHSAPAVGEQSGDATSRRLVH